MDHFLDLRRPRDLGALIGDGLSLWRRHFIVFFVLALVVVAPYELLVNGLWTGTLTQLDERSSSAAGTVVSRILDFFVVPVLVTAAHVVAVADVGDGVRPRVATSLAATAKRFLPVVLTTTLTTLVTVLGLVCLLVPGVWLGVRFFAAAQVVMLERQDGFAAMRRSAELVQGRWWSTFGTLMLVGILATVPAVVVGVLLGALSLVADERVVVGVATILVSALAQSLFALMGTLLFFSLRASR